MNRIDRYISSLFWGYFLGGIVVFVTVFVAIDAMSMMVNYKNADQAMWLPYYSYAVPDIIYKMLPIACLMSLVLTLSNLNRSNELVALYASGMSLFRISTPVLIWITFVCTLGFFSADRVLPRMAVQKNYIFYNHIKKNPAMFSMVKTNRIWYRSKNSLFNIKTLGLDGKTAQGLTMYFFSETWDLLQMITASRVEIVQNQWTLKNGTLTIFSKDSSFPLTSQFNKKTIIMDEDSKDLQSSGQTSDMLSQAELAKFITKNKEAGLETVRYEVDYHSKFGFAFAGLVMSLLGIPFSVGRARSGGTTMNIGICLGLVTAYWIVYSAAITLGQHGSIPPVVAAWFPNVCFVGVAYYLLKRLRQ